MAFASVAKRFALSVIVAALTFPVISSAKDSSTSNMPTGEAFITTAAKINLGEIALGRLAEQRGNNQAIKDFGKRMVEDHAKLEFQLQNVAKTEGVTLPAQPGSAVSTFRQQLSSDSGAQFDQTYIQHMLLGHKEAIADFENEIEHGQSAAFKSYAENALPVIQDHIRIAEDIAGKMQLSGRYGLKSPSRAINAPV